MRKSFEFLLKQKPVGSLYGVEVGVYKGDNAVDMLDNCGRLVLTLVDSYEPNSTWFTNSEGLPISKIEADKLYDDVKKRVNKYGSRANVIRNFSASTAVGFPDEMLDYVYIDGGHDFKNIMMDLISWIPKVKKEGILAGHDFNYFDVYMAVCQYVYGQQYDLFVENRDWWIIKKHWEK